MPSRGLQGLCVRGAAAAAACLLALASTGALVKAAVVASNGSAPPVTLMDKGGDGNGNGNGNGNSGGENNVSSQADNAASAAIAKLKDELKHHKLPTLEPAPSPAPTPKPKVHPKPAEEHTTSRPAAHAATMHQPTAVAHSETPAATTKVVVDSSDPAPFSAQTVAATDAARVLPVESLGPLSGISFGSGLFIWPLLLAVDVLALAVIARMALRRRFASPED